MTKVWLVTTGEYSDYRVDSAWATEELATQFADRIKGDVLELETRTELPTPLSILHLSCSVIEGGTERDSEWIEETWSGQDTSAATGETDCRAYDLRAYGSGGRAYVPITVFGTDHERVRKVYSEKKARAVAEFDILVAAARRAALLRGY
jgi:hypothetical protein